MTGRRRLLAIYTAGVVLAVLVVALIASQRRSDSETALPVAKAVDVDPALPANAANPVRGAPPPAAPPTGSLWQPVPPAVAAVMASQLDGPPSFDVYQDVEDRVLVQLVDRQRMLAVGDRLEVAVPQLDETYSPVVERIENGPGATRSVAGYSIDDAGGRHRFIYTVGPRSTFATIGTRDGVYELVANAEHGWLMPAANMDRHVDYSKPDYFIVRPGGPDRPGQ